MIKIVSVVIVAVFLRLHALPIEEESRCSPNDGQLNGSELLEWLYVQFSDIDSREQKVRLNLNFKITF